METVQPHFVPKVIKPKRNPKKEGCSRRSSPGLLIDTCGSSSALRYGWNDDSYIYTENVLKLFNLTTRAFQELFNLTTRAFQVCGNKSWTGTTLFVPHFVPRKVEKRSQPWLRPYEPIFYVCGLPNWREIYNFFFKKNRVQHLVRLLAAGGS